MRNLLWKFVFSYTVALMCFLRTRNLRVNSNKKQGLQSGSVSPDSWSASWNMDPDPTRKYHLKTFPRNFFIFVHISCFGDICRFFCFLWLLLIFCYPDPDHLYESGRPKWYGSDRTRIHITVFKIYLLVVAVDCSGKSVGGVGADWSHGALSVLIIIL